MGVTPREGSDPCLHTPPNTPHTAEPWWQALRIDAPGHPLRREVHQLLQHYRPTGFTRATPTAETHSPAETLSWDEMLDRIETLETAAATRTANARAAQDAQHLVDCASAHQHPDSDEPVTEGAWAGFTRGEARAWLFTLFEHERRGLVHPGSEVRARAIQATRAGEIPEVFAYPARARELASRGLTPESYRELRHSLRNGADRSAHAPSAHQVEH